MRLSRQSFITGLQILKWISEADHPQWTEVELRAVNDVLEVFQCSIHPAEINSFETITEIEKLVERNYQRQFVFAALIFALLNGDISQRKYERVQLLAKSFNFESKSLPIVEILLKGSTIRLRFKLMSRFWAIRKLKEIYKVQGVKAIAIFMFSNFFKIYQNKDLAEKYLALKNYPEGTLGREYAHYIISNRFSFPGEKGAASEIITFHDLCHVLSGYTTTPEEEVLTAAFMAGFMKKDDLNVLLFVLFQFHLGIRMTPGAQSKKGLFHVKDVLYALKRGALMNIDLTENWDYWKVMNESVDQLRAKYQIHSIDQVKKLFSCA